MAVKIIKTIKCPRCGSSNGKRITNAFYVCQQCNNNYYNEQEASREQIVSSGKSPSQKTSKSSFIIGIALAIIGGVYYIDKYTERDVDDNYLSLYETYHDAVQQEISAEPAQQDSGDNDLNNSGTHYSYVDEKINKNTFSLTTYSLYRDSESNQSYLIKSKSLTQDSKQDGGPISIDYVNGKFTGYDLNANKVIDEMFQVPINYQISIDSAILYADANAILLKDNSQSGYQLEMVDLTTGKLLWTLSGKELAGFSELNGKYNKNNQLAVELFRNNYRIKLPPNYYVVDKKGQVIGFGKL